MKNSNNWFFFATISIIFIFAIYGHYEQIKQETQSETCSTQFAGKSPAEKKAIKVTESVQFTPEAEPEQITSGVTKTKVQISKSIKKITISKENCNQVTEEDLASIESLEICGEDLDPLPYTERELEYYYCTKLNPRPLGLKFSIKNLIPDRTVLKILKKCNPERLTHLDLYLCDVSESTLKYLSKFKKLRGLCLSTNKLECIPEEIANLSNLEKLVIGNVPPDKISKAIFNLKNLKLLKLLIDISVRNSLKDLFNKIKLKQSGAPLYQYIPSEIGQLKNLETLSIGTAGIKLETLPKEIGNLKKLKTLWIAGDTALEALPDEICELENLEELFLGMNAMRDLPTSFGKLKKLKKLSLAASEFSNFPSQLCDLENLSYLTLTCKNLRELPKNIGKLKNLKLFSIYGGQLKTLPPEIGQLKNLNRFGIYDNQLTEIPKEIVQLKNLRVLELNGNQLSQLSKEINKMTWLTQLDIGNNKFKKFPNIFGLKNLFILTISHNQLTEIPEEINQLKRLGILDVGDNQIESLPKSFYDLNWGTIKLSRNKIQKLPSDIGRLKSSVALHLYLDHNQLKELPPEISKIEKLVDLNVSHNQLKKLPPEISKIKKGAYLNVSHNQLTDLPAELPTDIVLDVRHNKFKRLPKVLENWRKVTEEEKRHGFIISGLII